MKGNKVQSTAQFCECAQATLQCTTHIFICRCCNASMEGYTKEPLHLSSEVPQLNCCLLLAQDAMCG